MDNKQKFGSLYNSNAKEQNTTNSTNLFFAPFGNPISALEPKEEEVKSADNQKFINDMDSTLIMENIDKTAKNRVVKIDLKLNTLEKNISQINEELKILELFNLDKDKKRRDELTKLKENIIIQIKDLQEEKQKFGLIYILSAYTNNKITPDKLKDFWGKCLFYTDKYYKFSLDYLKNNKLISELIAKLKV